DHARHGPGLLRPVRLRGQLQSRTRARLHPSTGTHRAGARRTLVPGERLRPRAGRSSRTARAPTAVEPMNEQDAGSRAIAESARSLGFGLVAGTLAGLPALVRGLGAGATPPPLALVGVCALPALV